MAFRPLSMRLRPGWPSQTLSLFGLGLSALAGAFLKNFPSRHGLCPGNGFGIGVVPTPLAFLSALVYLGLVQIARPEPPPDFDQFWDYARPAATEQKFTALLPLAEKTENTSYHVELLTQIARSQGLQARFSEGQATLDRATALLTPEMNRPRARVLLERGRLFNSAGEPARAFPLFEQAWQAAEKAKAGSLAIDAIHMLAIAAPSPEEQIRWNLKGIRMVAADPAQKSWLFALYNNLGEAYAANSDFDEALKTFRQLADLSMREGRPTDPYNLKDQSRMLRQLGRLDEAMALTEPLWQEFSRGQRRDGWIDAEYAECLAAAGRAKEAAPIAAQAYEELKDDPWLKQNDPAFLQRLRKIAQRH